MNYNFNMKFLEGEMTKGKDTLYITPYNICADMISLLNSTGFFDEPDSYISKEDYINTHRVLDIFCKSGNLLEVCYYKFMFALRHVIPDEDDRDYFIWRNLLYGFCPTSRIRDKLCDRFYLNDKYNLSKQLGNFYNLSISFDKNIIKISGVDSDVIFIKNNRIFIGGVEVKFDAVVGNPPYNNDAYIDFVMLGHRLAKSYDLWITPAKFDFARRSDYYKEKWGSIIKNIVNCVFYQVEGEIFQITMPCGIAYYLCGKAENSTFKLTNKSKYFDAYNSETVDVSVDCPNFNIKSHNIIKKCSSGERLCLNKEVGLWNVSSSKTIAASGCGSKESKSLHYHNDIFIQSTVTNGVHISNTTDIGSCATRLYSFDSKFEAESFESYVETKLVRYLILVGTSGYSNIWTASALRFVPKPEAFDHIFTDDELYKKYDLTDEEIKIIESVVRERN